MKLLGKGLIFICVFTSCVSAYKFFQNKIPNGNRVPDTCYNITAERILVYAAVGHYKGDARMRNRFGEDFQAENFTWTQELCKKDSDFDGRPNGVELGDPDCRWNVNNTKEQNDKFLMPAQSNPGIYERMDPRFNQYYPAIQERYRVCFYRTVRGKTMAIGPFWL